MTSRSMWKEYDTRIEKKLQDLARKKAQLSSDIRLQNSTFGKKIEEAHLSRDIELLEKYRLHATLNHVSANFE